MEIICILDNIRSLHNVGSIFRTADAAGVKKIYLSGITPTPYDRLGRIREPFGKVSLGAEKTVLWEKVFSTTRLITKLKKGGFSVIAVEQSKQAHQYAHYLNKNKKKKLAFIFGNEVSGIGKTIVERANAVIEIPMRGKKESLNVAVTFGIIVFESQDHA